MSWFFHTFNGFFDLHVYCLSDSRCTWNSANIIKTARKLPLYVLAESFDLFYLLRGGCVGW